MTNTNQKQLGNTLWSIADQLRGAMDADDFRDYMLSFLFLRYLSGQLRDGGEEGAGAGLPRCGAETPARCRWRSGMQQRGRHPGVRKADAPQGALRHPARAPLEQHRQPGPHPERRLLNTLQAGFKYIETESFESTFQGLCSPRLT
jgi:type I restriction enzyme M protein